MVLGPLYLWGEEVIGIGLPKDHRLYQDWSMPLGSSDGDHYGEGQGDDNNGNGYINYNGFWLGVGDHCHYSSSSAKTVRSDGNAGDDRPSLGLGWGQPSSHMVCLLHLAWVPIGELVTKDGHGLLPPRIPRTLCLTHAHLLHSWLWLLL